MPLGCRCGRKRLYCNGVRLSCRHFCSDKALPAKTPGLPKSQAESRLQSKESHHTVRCQKKTILNGCLTIRKRVVGVILAISAVLLLYDLSCTVVMSATPQPRRLQWLEGLLDSMFFHSRAYGTRNITSTCFASVRRHQCGHCARWLRWRLLLLWASWSSQINEGVWRG